MAHMAHTHHIDLKFLAPTAPPDTDKVCLHGAAIVAKALSGPRGFGWKCSKSTSTEGNLVTYTCMLQKKSGRTSAEENQFAQIAQRIMELCNLQKNAGWFVANIDGVDQDHAPANPVTPKQGAAGSGEKQSPKEYFTALKMDRADHFDNLFGLENQISLGLSAIQAAIDSKFRNRFNLIYYGPAGCGKSSIAKAMGEMLGPEGEAWMRLDAPSTTPAGVQKFLLDQRHIPPVMFIEEIEKVPEQSLIWLLSVADIRAEVRKMNFRIGNASRSIQMLIVGTVNNMKLFRTLASGALASRFPNQIYCPRPTRETMRAILLREVHETPGAQEKWIDPTLDLAYGKLKLTDPRAIIPICLQGQNELLTGAYQKRILAVMEQQAKEVPEE